MRIQDLFWKMTIFVFGIFSAWIYFQFPSTTSDFSKEDLAELLKHSKEKISAESCGQKSPVIGSLLAAYFIKVNTKSLGQIHFNCIKNECQLISSNCLPWQSSECGSIILKYEIDENRKIKTSSLNCIEIP